MGSNNITLNEPGIHFSDDHQTYYVKNGDGSLSFSPVRIVANKPKEASNPDEFMVASGKGWKAYDFDRTDSGPLGERITVHQRDGIIDTVVFTDGRSTESLVPEQDGTYFSIGDSTIEIAPGVKVDAMELVGIARG